MHCKKKIIIPTALLLVALTCSSCSVKLRIKDHIDRTVPVIKGGPTDETITMRFYNDMPNVAYVGIREYYDCIMSGSLDKDPDTLTIEKKSEGLFLLSNPYGQAVADTVNDTLSSDDLCAFTDLMSLSSPQMPNTYWDGVGYARVSDYKLNGSGSITLDLGAYDIDIREDTDDVYFPESTLSDIFSDLAYHFSEFNGENFYFNVSIETADMALIDPDYEKPILAMLDEDMQRPEDITRFSYNELCFAIDNFYGFPGRAMINDEVYAHGLDAALINYGEAGIRTRELLQSRDFAEYLTGIRLLSYLLADGGHTGMTLNAGEDLVQLEERLGNIEQELSVCLEELYTESAKRYKDPVAEGLRYEERFEVYGDDLYIKKGDTAIFVLNSFMGFNFDEWDSFYKKGGELPDASQDDAIRLINALRDASSDPAIRNFVVDTSLNSGGSLDELVMLYSILTGHRKVAVPVENSLTKQSGTEVFESDSNLDRVFDDLDDTGAYDLNIGVLTSESVFSCGTVFSSLMRDAGYMILGQQSGGGSCAIQILTTGEGYTYHISSFRFKITNTANDDLDKGTPVDAKLPDLYDIDRISAEMNAFYENRQP